MDKKDILVIGGGICGLCSAYYLTQAGHRVLVLDQSNIAGGCSFGNAGMIVPSHFVPLAAPGMVSRGLRWMLRRDSPFYVHLSPDPSLFSWGWKFFRASNAERVQKAMPALRDISLLSRKLFAEIASSEQFSFSFETRGLLMLCKTEKVAEEEAHTAAIGNQLGIEAKVLNRQEVARMEPALLPDVVSGVHYPGDAHCNPAQLMEALKEWLAAHGATFFPECQVTGFRISGSTIKEIQTPEQSFQADEVILCAGSWSGRLARKLGLALPLQAGKGYGMTVARGSHGLVHPSILCGARVAITPMGDLLRFGGTMEIGGSPTEVNPQRVQGILKAITEYFPGFYPEVKIPDQVWSGLRPCSPDGMPYIGRPGKYRNLVVATGHAMMGLSLGPATGYLVRGLVENEKAPIELDLFSPDRYRYR